MKTGVAIKFRLTVLFLFFFEIAFLTFWRGKTGVFVSPVILFVSSLALVVLPFIFFNKYKIKAADYSNTVKKSLLLYPSLLFIVLSVVVYYLYARIINAYPVDYHVSDVIPTVDILSKRFLTGNFVYDVISEFGYELPPTYMPLQWLPFVISSGLGFDHRWMAFSIWLVAVFIFFIYQVETSHNYFLLLFNTTLPYAVVLIFIQNLPEIFANTFELMLAGYYLLFGLSLLAGKTISRALALSLTLLSRYTTVLFAPVYMLILFLDKKRKQAVWITMITFGLITAIYYIPFYLQKPEILTDGFQYYGKAALGEWQPKSWQPEGSSPFHLFRGVGFASWFYQFRSGPVAHRLALLRKVHLILSILAIITVFVVFIFFRKKIPIPLFLLLGLKFYLTFFYNFIQVPYIYLQLVPVFISVLIVSLSLQYSYRLTLPDKADDFI